MLYVLLRWTTILLGLLVVVSSATLAETTTDQVFEGLKKTEHSVTSASGTTVVSTTDDRPTVDGVTRHRESRATYKWAFKTPEWRHDVVTVIDSKETGQRLEGYVDSRYCIYAPDSMMMQIYGLACKGKMAVHPLWAQGFGFAFLLDDSFSSLSSQIAQANGRVAGSEVIDGMNAIVLEGKSPLAQSLRWRLLPDYGYLPARTEEQWADPSGVYKEIHVVTTYSEYTMVSEGVWLPRKKSVVKTATREDGSTQDILQVSASTTFDSVNTSINQDQLRIVPAAGTTVVYTEDIKTVE